MNKVYKKLRLKEVVFSDCSGVVCGYVSNRFIIAITTKLDKSFRKFDKEDTPFIEEEYKDVKYRYVYCDERDVYKSNPKMRKLEK
jgi:histidinol phosphatase-like enzyme